MLLHSVLLLLLYIMSNWSQGDNEIHEKVRENGIFNNIPVSVCTFFFQNPFMDWLKSFRDTEQV